MVLVGLAEMGLKLREDLLILSHERIISLVEAFTALALFGWYFISTVSFLREFCEETRFGFAMVLQNKNRAK